MPPAPGGGYLPYGTSMSDPSAPWNQREFETDFDEVDIIGFILDAEGDTPGGVAYEGAREDGSSEDAWFVDLPQEDYETVGPFDSYEEAVSYIAAEGEYEIEEALAEQEREDRIDAQY